MRRWFRHICVVLSLLLGLPAAAWAVAGDPQSSSNSYRVDESQVGGNGQFDSSSSNYSLNPSVDDGGASLGESAVGNSSSANYNSGAGFNTTAQPSLTLIVNTTNVDLGILSTITAMTDTATFSVKNYTSYGYVVQIIGPTPTYSGHPLTALTTDTASATGTEQFGINLRANTSPTTVGADPTQSPSGAFSYGEAGDGATGTYGSSRPYTQPNKYRYASGETIASAPKSSGETDYTMSFLSNISNTTPSGHYTGGISIVATGTY
jgi:hypothetical protein